MKNKPFSQACENNKDPILHELRRVLSRTRIVCEIGSGTGQHACYFAQNLSQITWQPTDKQENLLGISQWVADAQLQNLKHPVSLDVTDHPWSLRSMDAVFTANTLHIMGWAEVEILFLRLQEYLLKGSLLCIYGPFNYKGSYTSKSNAQFDLWLKQRNPHSAIRDFETVETLANKTGIQLLEDITMPTNNRLLVWEKTDYCTKY
jgi:cyclopropane fatty-acyl-phospholipid synthase-like methyltransferase